MNLVTNAVADLIYYFCFFVIERNVRNVPREKRGEPNPKVLLGEYLSRTTKDLLAAQLPICPRGPTGHSSLSLH